MDSVQLPLPIKLPLGAPMKPTDMSTEEAKEAIGTYVMNFAEYGMVPEIRPVQNRSGWEVSLIKAGEFSLSVKARTLVETLRRADMSASTYYAQVRIEESIAEDPPF